MGLIKEETFAPTDKQIVKKAIESFECAVALKNTNYLDTELMQRGPHQTYEWIRYCMDAACIAQQLYAEEMGWV